MTPFVQIICSIFLALTVVGAIIAVFLGAISLARGLWKQIDPEKKFVRTAAAFGLLMGTIAVVLVVAVFGAGAAACLWGFHIY